MQVLRTPDKYFENLADFPYEPNYIEINDLRMHYLDEGEGEVVLCLHGEPSWSYLYRKFIPILSPNYRVIAPDLIGFGRSDKLTKTKHYSFQLHFDQVCDFIKKIDLTGITLVVQDWGGLLGLSALGKMPERFARVVIMNTFLPTGDRKMPKAFTAWKTFAKRMPGFPVGTVMKMGTFQKLTAETKKAYQAPFHNTESKAGAKIFPELVPIKSTDEGVLEMQNAREVLGKWQKPALVMFSDKDAIMSGGDKFFRKLIPSAKDQPEIIIKDAGHFLQEDKGEEVATEIKKFIERTPFF
jgi:haloalkane dehalogenase